MTGNFNQYLLRRYFLFHRFEFDTNLFETFYEYL